MKVPFFGRDRTLRGGPERAGEAASMPRVDPQEQQLIYLAADIERVPDEFLNWEIGKLHPRMDVNGRGALVSRVLKMRHPETDVSS